jgi:hypothetical protein
VISILYHSTLVGMTTGGSVYLARVTAAWWRVERATRQARARRTFRSVERWPIEHLADRRHGR